MPRPDPLSVDDTLAQLAATPPAIAEMTAGVDAVRLRRPPAAGAWSPLEILAHLRSCADVRGAAARRILDEDHPRFRDVSPRIHQRSADYLELAFETSLRQFGEGRRDLLGRLRSLGPEQWARSATVIRTGKPVKWTVRWYGEWIASHERAHLDQLRDAVDASPMGD